MKSLSIFRKAFNSLSNRYSFVVITALLLAVGIFGYYFYFLVARSENLDARQYRVLKRIENQLRVNLDGYKGLAVGQVRAATDEVEDRVSDEKWRSIRQSEGASKEVRDSLNAKMNDVSFMRDARQTGTGLQLKRCVLLDRDTNLYTVPIRTIHHDMNDSLFLIHVEYPWNFKGERKIIIGVDYTLSINDALRPLLRADVFDGYMVLHSDSIVLETMSSGMNVFAPDTLKGDISSAAVDGNSVRSIMMNGQEYRTYEVGFSTDGETGWTIVGLKSMDDFSKERRTVPRHYLFAVFILALFVVCGIPFIKSMIMSRTERLATTDVLFSAIALALTASMVSILLMDAFLWVDVDKREQYEQLRSLSEQVESNLSQEVKHISEELNAYQKTSLAEDVINNLSERLQAVREKDSIQYLRIADEEQRRAEQLRDSLRYIELSGHIDSLKRMNPAYTPLIYPGFNNLYLVDTNGRTQHNVNDPKLNFNVHTRKYVSAWLDGECMNMRGVPQPVYLDAIISWREQEFRAAVSMQVNDPKIKTYTVVAMTTQLRSITHPVLPDGTGFCIFTESGTVMFHSNLSKCLNENIIEECDDSPELIAAIVGRSSTFIDAEYSGSRRRLFVRPLDGLPYFIATFTHREPLEAVHGQVFGTAFILQILLFAFYVCLILSGLLMLRRTTRLQHPFLDLSVFTPDVNGNERYTSAVLFNAFYAIILLFSAHLLPGRLTVIFLFLISAPYTVLMNTVLLSNLKIFELFQRKYIKMIIAVSVLIVIVNAVAWYYVGDIWLLLFVIQGLFVILFYCVEYRLYNKHVKEWYDALVMRLNYRVTYTLTIFMLVLLMCVLPAVTFALMTYDKEKEITVKTTQLQLMNQFTKIDFNAAVKKNAYDSLSDYSSSFYNTQVSDQPDSVGEVRMYTYSYDRFANWMREAIQNSGGKYNNIGYGASDSAWRWWYAGEKQLVMKAKDIESCDTQFQYRLESKVDVFSLPLFYNYELIVSVRFWLGLCGALVALYLVLRFFARKIFIHEKYSRTRALEFDEEFLRKAEPGYKAFVTGLPSAGKTNYFNALCHGKQNVHYINFICYGEKGWEELVLKAKEPGTGIVLIDHFEHDLLNETLTTIKLNLIEQLVALKDKKVVIISSIQPGVFTNMLETESKEPKDIKASRQWFERWNRVLAAFYVFIFPLQNYNRNTESILDEYLRLRKLPAINVPGKLVEFVERECGNGLFLRTIGLELMDELHRRETVQVTMDEYASRMEREDIIIRTQKMAETYYRSLWNHLAIEEQFVLHDLAQDGLVNARNLDIVEVLIDKGLVVYNTRLRLMNQSFRNFILSVVGPTDLGKLDLEMRYSGAWTKLKPALFLIVCSLFLFIIKSDRTQLFGYFTAFAAIIPIVVTVFSRFNQPDKKE